MFEMHGTSSLLWNNGASSGGQGMRNIFPQSMVNGIGGSSSSASVGLALAPGAQHQLAGASSNAYFSPSSNNFPYGGPGRGQPGSGTASSLSSMFSNVANKDLRPYEAEYAVHSLQQTGGPSGVLKSSSTADASRFMAVGGNQSTPSSSGVAAIKSLQQQQYQQMTGAALEASSQQQQQSLSSLSFHDNEFPSLTANRSAAANAASSSRSAASRTGAAGYANLMRQPETGTEFHIQNEDFPALPGSQDTTKQSNLPPATTDPQKDGRFAGDRLSKRGIQTHSDGSITGIPAGMLNDQFGMVGLVACLRAIESDPTIIPLALGHDLTTLGLNLNAVERNLYQNFGGPWADSPCRPQDIDYCVPPEYLTNANIMDKLSPIKLNRYTDDLLFYLFYNFGGEAFQLAAAAELYNRDWRYHKEEKCWITRASGQAVVERTAMHERGTYFVFDATHWRKVPKEMTLEYDKLEERPMLPPQQQQSQQQQQQQATPAIVNPGNIARNA